MHSNSITPDDNQNSRMNFLRVFTDKYGRLIAAILLTSALFNSNRLGELTRSSVFDAYTQVSVFVAITLLLFFSLEHFLDFDIGEKMRQGGNWQVPIATGLGALPGCGGAVVVITSFARGNITLGAMVGALISTMGDAAFLLLVKEPMTYVVVLLISCSTGIVCGWLVDRFHPGEIYVQEITHHEIPVVGKLRVIDIVYIIIVLPGLIIGIMQLMQLETPELGGLTLALGLFGAIMSIFIWALSPISAVSANLDHPFTRTTEETSFVTSWVIAAYLAYEYAFEYLGLDIAALAEAGWLFVPLIAILVGFIPGCGPQIIITTLYLNGVIPFAAMIGNAISNDGDALFPAIALAPKMAIIATLYSAIPALIISYTFLFLM